MTEQEMLPFLRRHMRSGRMLIIEVGNELNTIQEAVRRAASCDASFFIYGDRLYSMNMIAAPVFKPDGEPDEMIAQGVPRVDLATGITSPEVAKAVDEEILNERSLDGPGVS